MYNQWLDMLTASNIKYCQSLSDILHKFSNNKYYPPKGILLLHFPSIAHYVIQRLQLMMLVPQMSKSFPQFFEYKQKIAITKVRYKMKRKRKLLSPNNEKYAWEKSILIRQCKIKKEK